MNQPRRERIIVALKAVFEEVSGLTLDDADPDLSFLEMGLDSLTLTQAAGRLKKKTGVKVTFRQLMDEAPSLGTLAALIDANAPPEAFAAPASAPLPTRSPAALTAGNGPAPPSAAAGGALPSTGPSPEHAPGPAPWPTPAAAPATAPPGGTAAPPFAAWSAGWPAAGAAASLDPQTAAYAWQQYYAQLHQHWQQHLQHYQQYYAAWYQAQAGHPAPAGFPAPAEYPTPAGYPAPAGHPAPHAASGVDTPPAAVVNEASTPRPPVSAADTPKKFIGPAVRISTEASRTEIDGDQRRALDAFFEAYAARTRRSKAFTQEHRHHLADPRAVSGFKPAHKEVTYPIVVDKSDGCRLWDLDGNEYVDVTCGFGTNVFGHRPDFINEAVKAQLDTGYEIGPQTPLAGDVAGLICEMTGHERVALCNTGSEAVLGAMRMARTVTGNDVIAVMNGAYHGINNEVIVRGTRSHRAIPAAPGIPSAQVENMLVVDYDDPASLEVLRARADDLAAIMIEPVQSRRPDLQPRAFLHACRQICDDADIPLILDEVITGFRIAPGGAQEHFEVRADICTYGKIIGGGLPIGAIAGRRTYLDALDGGHWQFGDDSFPEVGVTYFAGTFVRWPLALAAAKAALLKLQEYGAAGHQRLNAMTDAMCAQLNATFAEVGAPIRLKHFGSLWKPTIDEAEPHGSLVFHWLRHKGIHIWEGRPCFLTFAHAEADVARVVAAWEETVAEMQAEGLLSGNGRKITPRPPVPGARLGRDAHGKPAWFVEDPDRLGAYLQVHTGAGNRAAHSA